MTARVLVYGYGNPGRLDDGLGPALIRDLAGRQVGQHVTLESGYQLQIEDAALVADHSAVVFVDADRACPSPFELRRLAPQRDIPFSTHSMAPAAVLALAREHFGCNTVGFILGIRGYQFEAFGESLSPEARRNLAAAVDYMAGALRAGRFAAEAVPAQQEG